jgi:hypothetical protein
LHLLELVVQLLLVGYEVGQLETEVCRVVGWWLSNHGLLETIDDLLDQICIIAL